MTSFKSALGFILTWMPGWSVSLILHLTCLTAISFCYWSADRGSHSTLAFINNLSGGSESVELIEFVSEIVIPTADLTQLTSSDVGDLGDGVGALSTIAADVDSIMADPGWGTYGTNGALEFAGKEIRAPRDEKQRGAEFYGIHAEGNSFVFIVDRSNSMNGLKLREAKTELMYALRRLSPEQTFYVIFFAGNSEFMHWGPWAEPEPKPVPATLENLAKVEAWVSTVQVQPWTNPFDGVKFALTLEPDAIFLLTDGEFTDEGRTVRYLQHSNVEKVPGNRPRPKIVMNCIGFHSRDGEQTLKKLAKNFGGSYRFVPPPQRLAGPR